MFRQTLFGLLAGWYGLLGLFMALDPGTWWSSVPGVEATGAFNPHFIRDIGFAFVASAIGFAGYARSPRAITGAVVGAVFVGLHGFIHVFEILFFHVHGPVVFELLGISLPGLIPAAALLLMRDKAHA